MSSGRDVGQESETAAVDAEKRDVMGGDQPGRVEHRSIAADRDHQICADRQRLSVEKSTATSAEPKSIAEPVGIDEDLGVTLAQKTGSQRQAVGDRRVSVAPTTAIRLNVWAMIHPSRYAPFVACDLRPRLRPGPAARDFAPA